ncbi:bacterial low temperature requirement A protein-domain-containing protein [Cercophora newfieldiana]|uniref:Bacterial low temperature requirement A protein-domain-containing protein n=1 Tax=Cercophora newfieldiana TaxID=92897 RepID=A0AA40CQU4_9PEZI|nr:bacterial low temperature requirement A protein-domain-containing protein [Cercophora newfieldiana]
MHPFRRRKTIHEDRAKRRIHRVVPWIQNPLQGVDREHLLFAPRQEASTLELFFDLFFVANLATFTAYHSIDDHSSLFAYIGFFAIIWVTWFHTVLYDVRFETDSIYSRACKTLIMICFVGFALVGSNFAPGTDKGDNTNFRILCYTLVLSRVLFLVQYVVVGIFVGMAGRHDIFLPLFLNVAVYAVAAGAYAAMISAFAEGKELQEGNGIYSVWWVVMLLETVATIAISSCWRMLSFRKTHIVERMGLLTLIVIGEGAIGATKTVSRVMGKTGLEPEASGLVFCIVLILVGIWMIYFDNHPHGHFGTIKQQIWSVLHFPIHLAIVGLVEGAQQVALARYIARGILKLEHSFTEYCFRDHLDGEKLTEKLASSINYLQLDKKLHSLIYLDEIQLAIWEVGNTTGICDASGGGTGAIDFPEALSLLYANTAAAMYSALGLAIPLDKDVIETMFESWKLVYRYFWAAFMLLMACFLVVMVLIRTTKSDVFDWVAVTIRATSVIASLGLLLLSVDKKLMYGIMETGWILPVSVGMIYLIIVLDRISALIANRRNRKSGVELVGQHKEHGHRQSSGGSGTATENDQKSLVSGSVTPVGPGHVSHRESYNPLGTGMMPSYYDHGYTPSPQPHTPMMSPGLGEGYPMQPMYNPGGYMPVQN